MAYIALMPIILYELATKNSWASSMCMNSAFDEVSGQIYLLTEDNRNGLMSRRRKVH